MSQSSSTRATELKLNLGEIVEVRLTAKACSSLGLDDRNGDPAFLSDGVRILQRAVSVRTVGRGRRTTEVFLLLPEDARELLEVVRRGVDHLEWNDSDAGEKRSVRSLHAHIAGVLEYADELAREAKSEAAARAAEEAAEHQLGDDYAEPADAENPAEIADLLLRRSYEYGGPEDEERGGADLARAAASYDREAKARFTYSASEVADAVIGGFASVKELVGDERAQELRFNVGCSLTGWQTDLKFGCAVAALDRDLGAIRGEEHFANIRPAVGFLVALVRRGIVGECAVVAERPIPRGQAKDAARIASVSLQLASKGA